MVIGQWEVLEEREKKNIEDQSSTRDGLKIQFWSRTGAVNTCDKVTRKPRCPAIVVKREIVKNDEDDDESRTLLWIYARVHVRRTSDRA